MVVVIRLCVRPVWNEEIRAIQKGPIAAQAKVRELEDLSNSKEHRIQELSAKDSTYVSGRASD